MSADRPDIPATTADVLIRALADHPDRDAVIDRYGRLTYAELDAAAHRAAHVLWDLGVRPGDRVAVSLPNDAEAIVTFHAVGRLGAVWVGVNQALAPPEKAFTLGDCGAGMLLASPAVVGQLAAAALPPGLRRIVAVDRGDPAGEWATACAGAPTTPLAVPVDSDAPAGIAYTSGTTGFPKGVVHSHHNLLVPGASLVAQRGWGVGLRKGDSFPLTILNLQILTSMLTAQAGGCAVIMDRTDARGVAEWIRRERVTVWNGAPATLYSLATDGEISAGDLASLDEVWAGGGDLAASVRAAFTRKFGVPLSAVYGLTEAPTVVTMERPGTTDPPSNGPPLSHLAVRIVDDQGRRVGPGQTGEVVVGPTAEGPWAGIYTPMLGYWGRPEATAAVLVDGWLHTGDIGLLDERGNLLIRDRKNVMIIRGGANVYPAEVERVLVAVEGVRGAVVVGVADERLGERVIALLEVDDAAGLTATDLEEHCRGELARYKIPEQFIFVDTLPRNAMNKVDRGALKPLLEPTVGSPAS